MFEKSGELVAQFKTTVLLMPNGSDRYGAELIQMMIGSVALVKGKALVASASDCVRLVCICLAVLNTLNLCKHWVLMQRLSWSMRMYRITSAPLQEISTDKQVTDEEVKTLLAASLKSKKKNKKKKAAKVENGAKEVEAEQ